MKIVVVSDLHLDAVTAGVSRFDEVERALLQAVDYAVENLGPDDLFVCLGDVADPDCGPIGFRISKLLVKVVVRLWGAEVSSLWVGGNHDPVMDGRGQTVLAPLKALEEELGFEGSGVKVVVAEGPVYFKHGEHGVFALPYPGAVAYDPGAFLAPSFRALVFSHLVVPGLLPGEESLEMARGKDVFFPVEVAARENVRPALIVNGHHHTRQVVRQGGVEIYIPGSAARLTFGEQSNPEPSYLVFEV